MDLKKMRVLWAILGFCLIGSGEAVGSRDAGFTPTYNPELTLSKTVSQIKIDGRIDDAGWIGAARADNFSEHYPGDQSKPPVETEAYVTYDDNMVFPRFR